MFYLSPTSADPCDELDCRAVNECVLDGECHNGECVYPYAPNDTPCDDGDVRTALDMCVDGACTGIQPVFAGNVTAYTVGGLDPFRDYAMTVAAATPRGLGPWQNNFTMRTDQAEPSAAPQDVKATNLSSTTVQLTFSPPPVLQQNGIITNYTVWGRLMGATAWAHAATAPDSPIAISSLDGVTPLSKFTQYEFQVQAATKVGFGPRSASVSVVTAEDAPTAPPENVTGYTPATGSILVTWEPPEAAEHHGIIRGYILSYIEQDEAPISRDVGLVQEFLLTDLDHYAWHNITVAAYTLPGLVGPASDYIQLQTIEHIPRLVFYPRSQ